jgi:hypothetical protein
LVPKYLHGQFSSVFIALWVCGKRDFGSKYLPEKFKDDVKGPRLLVLYAVEQKKIPSAVKSHKEIVELTEPPKEKILIVQKYANTHFVNIIVEKSFYEEFEKASSELGVSTEISMLKALEDYHEKMKKALALKKLEEKVGTRSILLRACGFLLCLSTLASPLTTPVCAL